MSHVARRAAPRGRLLLLRATPYELDFANPVRPHVALDPQNPSRRQPFSSIPRPSASSPPHSLLSHAAALDTPLGTPSTRQDRQQWSAARAQQKSTPNPVRSIDTSGRRIGSREQSWPRRRRLDFLATACSRPGRRLERLCRCCGSTPPLPPGIPSRQGKFLGI